MHFNELAHYGVKGMKKGLRRFQNEDGSLTSEGRDHYGVGGPRQAGSGIAGGISQQRISAKEHNYRVKRFGKSSAKVLDRKPKQLSPEEQKARDAKRKKIIAAAAGIGIAAIGIGVAAHQHQKVTRNLVEMAKNKVHKDYVTRQNRLNQRVDLTKNERQAEQAKLNQDRTRDMMNVYSRHTAKKALGLSGRKNREKARAYIKENNLRRIHTSEITERRTGRLVEGYKRSKLTGRMRAYTELERRRAADKRVRSMRRTGL